MSGFFSHKLLNKQSTRKFLKHRRKRILVPLIIASVIILPAEIYLWIIGLIGQERCTFTTLINLQFEEPENSLVWGLSHLWYLEYLLIYSLMYCWIRNRNLPLSSRLLEKFSQSQLLPFWVGFLTAGVLLYNPLALVGFQHAFLPVPSKFVLNGLFFMTGIFLSQNRGILQQWKQDSIRYLLIAALLAPFTLLTIQEYVGGNVQWSLRFTLAVVAGMFATLTTCGLIGLVQHQRRKSYAAISEISESSYWVYLVHHPFTALCHIAFVPLGISASGKFLLAFVTTNIFCRLTYQALVRYSWLGELLNGYRAIRPQSATVLFPAAAVQQLQQSESDTKTAA